MKLYIYKKCSTCQKALRFLEKTTDQKFDVIEIDKTPPSMNELKQMLQYQKGDFKKLFNTSGILYREQNLAEKLKGMPLEEALSLLTKQGMLVKRPFLLGQGFGLLGFKEEEWKRSMA